MLSNQNHSNDQAPINSFIGSGFMNLGDMRVSWWLMNFLAQWWCQLTVHASLPMTVLVKATVYNTSFPPKQVTCVISTPYSELAAVKMMFQMSIFNVMMSSVGGDGWGEGPAVALMIHHWCAAEVGRNKVQILSSCTEVDFSGIRTLLYVYLLHLYTSVFKNTNSQESAYRYSSCLKWRYLNCSVVL